MLDTPASNQSYAARFLARVDEHLPKLSSDAARKAFLSEQHRKYEEDYAHFQQRGYSAFNLGDGPQPSAEDYVLTLTGLTTRIQKIAGGQK